MPWAALHLQHMLATGDFNLRDEKGNVIAPQEVKQNTTQPYFISACTALL